MKKCAVCNEPFETPGIQCQKDRDKVTALKPRPERNFMLRHQNDPILGLGVALTVSETVKGD
jgi:hypothetical protein